MKWFSLFFFSVVTLFGWTEECRSIRSFKEISFNDLPEQTLVLFDVDEVLVTPADALLKPAGGGFSGWATIDKKQFDECLSIMLAGTQYVLVDAEAPEIIAGLSEQGIAAMGFTSCRTGRFGIVDSMEGWRFDQLAAVGIDFGSFFAEEFAFAECVGPEASPPVFKRGILFCGDYYDAKKSTKGKLLGMLLDRLGWTPSQVIFIDDEEKNLKAVGEELEKREIPFQGYRLEIAPCSLDEQVATTQIQSVIEKKKWVSDEEALSPK